MKWTSERPLKSALIGNFLWFRFTNTAVLICFTGICKKIIYGINQSTTQCLGHRQQLTME